MVSSPRIPFYLKNLEFVLAAVLDAPWSDSLFDGDDRQVAQTFTTANENTRKLFARLFMRRRGWFRVAKLKYPELEEDMPQLIDGAWAEYSNEDGHTFFIICYRFSGARINGLSPHANGCLCSYYVVIESELQCAGLLETSTLSLNDLAEALELLQIREVVSLAKVCSCRPVVASRKIAPESCFTVTCGTIGHVVFVFVVYRTLFR